MPSGDIVTISEQSRTDPSGSTTQHHNTTYIKFSNKFMISYGEINQLGSSDKYYQVSFPVSYAHKPIVLISVFNEPAVTNGQTLSQVYLKTLTTSYFQITRNAGFLSLDMAHVAAPGGTGASVSVSGELGNYKAVFSEQFDFLYWIAFGFHS